MVFSREKVCQSLVFTESPISGGIRDECAHLITDGRVKPYIGHSLKPRAFPRLRLRRDICVQHRLPFPCPPFLTFLGSSSYLRLRNQPFARLLLDQWYALFYLNPVSYVLNPMDTSIFL